MKSILLAHAKRYPLMQPTDAVKLIYQNEFGGGHLIRDEAACLAFLHREYESTEQRTDLPLLEEIGNGMVRIHLAALDAHRFSPADLGQAFLRSANIHRGRLASFRQKLTDLLELTRTGELPFSMEDLQTYLTAYEKAGFPPVSHSDIYRAAYQPAYRILKKGCLPKDIFLQMP